MLADMRSKWTPPVTEELAKKSLAAVVEIADVLAQPRAPEARGTGDHHLANGSAGIALLFAYMAFAAGKDIVQSNAIDCLNLAIDGMSQKRMSVGLYSGFTGIAWATEHLSRLGLMSDVEDADSAVDTALVQYLRSCPQEDSYDLIGGLVGIGIYALERLPKASAEESLDMIVQLLVQRAERNDRHATWHTPPSLVWHEQREEFPTGYYNLGVAHGVPGVIAFLAMVYTAGIRKSECADLLNGAVNWILQQESTYPDHSHFPMLLSKDSVNDRGCRLAWCYGDAGIAASLLLAGRQLRVANWEEDALRIARDAAKRPFEASGVVDACLCHGSAGLAHIFNRLYQMTGADDFQCATQQWVARTLAFRQPGMGIAGFLTRSYEQGKFSFVGIPGLLEGAAGIALMLLAAASEIEPCWDRVLLLSTRFAVPVVHRS